MTESICPLCGSEVVVIWNWNPVYCGMNDGICYTYAVRCSNDDCRPVKIELDGEEVRTFASIQGISLFKSGMDLDALKEAENGRLKKKFIEEVRKEFIEEVKE